MVLIVSYTMLIPVHALLLKEEWDMLVCDEAHCLKHESSKRTKLAIQFSKRVPRLLLLSGTPALRNIEYYTLLRMLDHVTFQYLFHYQTQRKPSLQQFYYAERYCAPEKVHVVGSRQVWSFKQNARTDELKLLLAKYMIVLKTKDVLQLPPYTEEQIMVATASEHRKKYFTTQLAKVETIRETRGSLFADALFMQLVRDTMRLKIQPVCEYLESVLVDSTDQCIVFAYHREMLDSLHLMLSAKNVSHIQIDGSVCAKDRARYMEQMERGEVRVGLLSLSTCSTGLNFTFCHWMITAELCFHADLHMQSEFRCYRHGQLFPVLHQTLLMDSTTDHAVLGSIRSKKTYNK